MATSDPGAPGRLRRWRATLREDSVAGLVLGVQSVPDGLATGLLAGVNPLAGLYAYLFGTFTGALFTGSAFMAVQATGAMSMVVSDVPAVHDGPDPAGALFTLSVLTGIVMLAAGLLRLGYVLRFVPTRSWSASSRPSGSTSCSASWTPSPATTPTGPTGSPALSTP